MRSIGAGLPAVRRRRRRTLCRQGGQYRQSGIVYSRSAVRQGETEVNAVTCGTGTGCRESISEGEFLGHVLDSPQDQSFLIVAVLSQ